MVDDAYDDNDLGMYRSNLNKLNKLMSISVYLHLCVCVRAFIFNVEQIELDQIQK